MTRDEKQVFHSSLQCSKSEMESIEDVEKNHPSITIADEELYDVKL